MRCSGTLQTVLTKDRWIVRQWYFAAPLDWVRQQGDFVWVNFLHQPT